MERTPAQTARSSEPLNEGAFEQLHSLGDPEVDYALAGRADLTSAQQVTLAKHRRLDVRAHLAGNPGLHLLALEVLATDPKDTVRSEAARNPYLPQEILARLAGDASDDVRLSVAFTFTAQRAGKPLTWENTTGFPLAFLQEWWPTETRSLLLEGDADEETLRSIAVNWKGTLHGLREASGLVKR